MNVSAGTGPVLVLQVTVAVSIITVITQDIVVSEPSFTSLLTDVTTEMNCITTNRNMAVRFALKYYIMMCKITLMLIGEYSVFLQFASSTNETSS